VESGAGDGQVGLLLAKEARTSAHREVLAGTAANGMKEARLDRTPNVRDGPVEHRRSLSNRQERPRPNDALA
jgi:hypothetical protein